MLSRFPRSGRKVPEFDDDDIRELLAYSYRIIYRVQENEVIIAAVIHGRRMLQ
jgi:toxin ParE1/3/4